MHTYSSTRVAAALIALAVFLAVPPAKASTPEVIAKRNGETEVVFRENNCVVYYDARGRLVRANNNCRRQQKQQADAAHMQFRSEQGVTSRSREERGDPEAGYAEWQRRQRASEEGDPEAGYAEWQRRQQASEEGDPEAGYAEWQRRQRASEEGDPEAGYAEWQRRQQASEEGDPEAGYAEWQRQQDAARTVPQLRVRRNGQGEVIFESNNCVVNFNPQGKRVKQSRNCSRDQVRRADDAMASYRREQEM